tara:strand:+ start:2325 stop:3608 length:1284 start_codon:yes stop_codon:yes gene_type:complete
MRFSSSLGGRHILFLLGLWSGFLVVLLEVQLLAQERKACPNSKEFSEAFLPKGYCAVSFASQLAKPRGIEIISPLKILVVEADRGQISLLHDRDGNGAVSSQEKLILVSAPGLNHGLALSNRYLYASSSTTVYRWSHRTVKDRIVLGKREVVITGIPGGGHWTRTLVLDSKGSLFVSIGSRGNVDPDSRRARLLRFSKHQLQKVPVPWKDGEVFADGLRNEVGLAFDHRGRLWGVENGVDNLFRQDLGGDIHNDNPGEELNLFSQAGKFYGYPQCWSEYLLPKGKPSPGRQWVHPMFSGRASDSWCRNPKNVVPPKYVLPAHTAPLGLFFYPQTGPERSWRGDAFVALHGSWNRDVPIGYEVVRIPFKAGMPLNRKPARMFSLKRGKDQSSRWRYRPVDVKISKKGVVFFSSDHSGQVIKVFKKGPF